MFDICDLIGRARFPVPVLLFYTVSKITCLRIEFAIFSQFGINRYRFVVLQVIVLFLKRTPILASIVRNTGNV